MVGNHQKLHNQLHKLYKWPSKWTVTPFIKASVLIKNLIAILMSRISLDKTSIKIRTFSCNFWSDFEVDVLNRKLSSAAIVTPVSVFPLSDGVGHVWVYFEGLDKKEPLVLLSSQIENQPALGNFADEEKTSLLFLIEKGLRFSTRAAKLELM